MVVSMLVTAIYNVVDTYFVSGLGTQQAGAVSVAFPLSLIFSGIGLTFGVGAGSYISRLLGKKQVEEAHCAASTAMFSSVIASFVVAAALFFVLTPVLSFMGAIPSIMPFAEKHAGMLGGIILIRFESEITPAVTDRMITLSTCSYEFDDARFVLLGAVRDN